MARVPEPRLQAGQNGKPTVVGVRAELVETGCRICTGIDRGDRAAVAAGGATVELLDLDLLNMGTVGQHHPGQIGRRMGRVDWPGKPVFHQFGQQA